MPDKDAIIKKIQSLPDTDLQEVAEYLDFLEVKKTSRKRKPDAFSQVIGICEGPSDLAEKHDSYAY
jgi:Protein of unknown function (DUF2281)